jgi:hypothetical protein
VDIQQALELIVNGQNLSAVEMKDVMRQVMPQTLRLVLF